MRAARTSRPKRTPRTRACPATSAPVTTPLTRARSPEERAERVENVGADEHGLGEPAAERVRAVGLVDAEQRALGQLGGRLPERAKHVLEVGRAEQVGLRRRPRARARAARRGARAAVASHGVDAPYAVAAVAAAVGGLDSMRETLRDIDPTTVSSSRTAPS